MRMLSPRPTGPFTTRHSSGHIWGPSGNVCRAMKSALLGPRRLFVPPRSAYHRVVSARVQPRALRLRLAEVVHLGKYPAGVDVQYRHGQPPGGKCLARQVRHGRCILADAAIQQVVFAVVCRAAGKQVGHVGEACACFAGVCYPRIFFVCKRGAIPCSVNIKPALLGVAAGRRHQLQCLALVQI